MGGGGGAAVRELPEAGGQPLDDVRDVGHACQHEKDSFDSVGGEDKEKHEQKIALGGDCEAFE